jgi:hypothetical protein
MMSRGATYTRCVFTPWLEPKISSDFLSVATEQTKAFQTGTLALEIVGEREKLKRAIC